MGLLEPHAGHGGGDGQGQVGPAVVVHTLAQAAAALAAAERAGKFVALFSAPGAAGSLGPAVFREMIAEARRRHPGARCTAVLDCADEPGVAMAALREGVDGISLVGPAGVLAKLRDMAEQSNAGLVARPVGALDLDGVDDPAAAVAKLLSEDRP